MSKTKKAAPQDVVYQLRIELLEVTPPVWRRVLVRGRTTLGELHLVLNEAMGWACCHLHLFTLGERTFGDPEVDADGASSFEDGREVRLDVALRAGEAMRYEYDFGDGWEHEVRVEKVLRSDPRLAYPLCVGGARACPPEDVGGPLGYERLLEALSKPKDPEHDELLMWVGGYFDPEGFDANRTNESLHALEHMK